MYCFFIFKNLTILFLQKHIFVGFYIIFIIQNRSVLTFMLHESLKFENYCEMSKKKNIIMIWFTNEIKDIQKHFLIYVSCSCYFIHFLWNKQTSFFVLPILTWPLGTSYGEKKYKEIFCPVLLLQSKPTMNEWIDWIFKKHCPGLTWTKLLGKLLKLLSNWVFMKDSARWVVLQGNAVFTNKMCKVELVWKQSPNALQKIPMP